MHYGHDHHHPPGSGHSHPHRPQKPAAHDHPERAGEHDVGLVEAAFVESFAMSSDPASFLRLARVPFRARDGEGRELVLLRVEIDSVTDVGSITPNVAGSSFRYDPMPAKMVTRRRRLRFAYFDGDVPRSLTLAEVHALAEG